MIQSLRAPGPRAEQDQLISAGLTEAGRPR